MSINLVSMMDIFTILVFFLLVNSSDVEVLPNAKEIVLPTSTAPHPVCPPARTAAVCAANRRVCGTTQKLGHTRGAH